MCLLILTVGPAAVARSVHGFKTCGIRPFPDSRYGRGTQAKHSVGTFLMPAPVRTNVGTPDMDDPFEPTEKDSLFRADSKQAPVFSKGSFLYRCAYELTWQLQCSLTASAAQLTSAACSGMRNTQPSSWRTIQNAAWARSCS